MFDFGASSASKPNFANTLPQAKVVNNQLRVWFVDTKI